MKYTAAQIASYMRTLAEDTATVGFESFDVIFRKGFFLAQVGGEEMETNAPSLLVPTDDAGSYTGLSSLDTTVEHGTPITVRSTSYLVDGVREADPMEGMTRLILVEA